MINRNFYTRKINQLAFIAGLLLVSPHCVHAMDTTYTAEKELNNLYFKKELSNMELVGTLKKSEVKEIVQTGGETLKRLKNLATSANNKQMLKTIQSTSEKLDNQKYYDTSKTDKDLLKELSNPLSETLVDAYLRDLNDGGDSRLSALKDLADGNQKAVEIVDSYVQKANNNRYFKKKVLNDELLNSLSSDEIKKIVKKNSDSLRHLEFTVLPTLPDSPMKRAVKNDIQAAREKIEAKQKAGNKF
jgi:arsenate reductase-like glutaredoxin family protein